MNEEICQNLWACEKMLGSIVEGVKLNNSKKYDPLSQMKMADAMRKKYIEAFTLRKEGKTYREIGIVFGVSRSRAQVLCEKGRFYITRKRY
jgi:uncharacterized metal-binding protein